MPTLRLLTIAASIAIAASSPSATGASFSSVDVQGKTALFYDKGHGNQVEFYDPDGRCFLWYPGNTKAVPGQWLVSGQNICFQYGKNTYNPVTGEKGDDWHCEPIQEWKKDIVDTVLGDVFSLSLTGAPYQLPARPKFESITELKNLHH